MSLDEKSGDVTTLTIEAPRKLAVRPPVLSTIEDVDSTHSQSPTLTPTITRPEDEPETKRGTHPFSPFYSHRKTSVSMYLEKSESESESKVNLKTYDTDLEANLTNTTSKVLRFQSLKRKSTNKDCTVWPGQKALKAKKKELKRQQGCTPWSRLTKSQKIWIKVIIALVIVGLAVGLGLGVSKAVGGGIWRSTSAPMVPAS